jgi:hypothetical protein
MLKLTGVALAALFLTAALQAQTTTTSNFTMVGLTGKCANPLGCNLEPFDATSGNPWYAWAYASYTTGIVPSTPYPPVTPATGAGSGTFEWSNGAAANGTLSLALSCTLTGSLPSFTVTCDGDDGEGNIVHLVHRLYLHQVKMGRGPVVWQWVDFGGSMNMQVTV